MRFEWNEAKNRQNLVVVSTDRGDDVVRIVSARMATKREAEWFREKMGNLL